VPVTLFSCDGGSVALPALALVMVDRADGGHLVVNPPRGVWDRTALSPAELTRWSWLVAATARAMLEVLPQLTNGCINYWDAGNWALNDAAPPVGRKTGPAHRKLHMHLLGRSPHSVDPAWRWGEAPRYPLYADRHIWAAGRARFTVDECRAVIGRVQVLLQSVYGVGAESIAPVAACASCRYPVPVAQLGAATRCEECR
jgi:diadenosine tetraphosphate (Ap4A) HIT family hydrolase